MTLSTAPPERRDDERRSDGERIAVLETMMTTVVATKEDLAKAESRTLKWVIGLIVGLGTLVFLILRYAQPPFPN